ncbi:MAG: extracytoplasmic sigma factor ECF [Planctomycetota bacterium]|nr:MAG: extracytoplasmic sigma factor ECF [Planctomycetota bacterium]
MEGRSEAAGEGALEAVLARVRAGDTQASDELFVLLYDELRRTASALLASESPGQTLQPTALLNEAFLKLFRGKGTEVRDRAHVFSLTAKAMRQVLIDRARAKLTLKRTRPETLPQVDIAVAEFQHKAVDLFALDEALQALAERSEQHVQIVELRFFAGLTVEQVAEVVGISARQVSREWTLARAFLRGQLS